MAATGRVATAAGTAVLVYLVLSGRLCGDAGADGGREDQEQHQLTTPSSSSAAAKAARRRKRWRKEERRWPEHAPAGCGEAAAVAARTVRLAWAETLGKWPLGELAFGIKYYMRQQGNLQHEYAGSDSVRLDGPEVRQELVSLLRYLKLCMYFSKKPYAVFMELGGYARDDDVLVKKSKGRLLKPCFTIVRDGSTKCFLLFIRGAIGVRERLTAATGGEVPFHHVVVEEGCVSKLVLGHAHCGMVVAARWIANRAVPCLTKAVEEFPDYSVKIIGHSMGAAIAAILTYILRENEKLSSSTCLAFGPAACMTWDLAESSKDFVTTIVNRNDVVPSLGIASAAKLRTEVMASSWVHDLRDQIQQTRFLGFVNRSVSFIRSRVPCVPDPRSKVTDVDMLQPHRAKDGRRKKPSAGNGRAAENKRHGIACWSRVAATRKHAIEPSKQTEKTEIQTGSEGKFDKFSGGTGGSELVSSVTLGDLILQESDSNKDDVDREDEEESSLKGTDEEEAVKILDSLAGENQVQSSSASSHQELPGRQLYPPGRILHMVGLPAAAEPYTNDTSTGQAGGPPEDVVALYETPRHLYGKIRLARSMVGEHYMPKYIRTIELLIDRLAEETDDQLDSL